MKRIAFYLLCLLLALQLMSCSKNKAAKGKSTEMERVFAPGGGTQGLGSDEGLAPELLGSTAKAEAQNNDFSFRLWNMIDREGENAFFSPHSINSVLAMAYGGSKGNTAKEIASVMAYDFEPGKSDPVLATMYRILNKRGGRDQAEVNIANAIFTPKENQDRLLPAYLELLKKEYFAQLHSLDFSNAWETANFINNWVAENTNNRIQKMVDEEQIESLGRGLFLANAIYFKARWRNQFEESATHEDTFYTSSARREEESKRIDMMLIKSFFPYAKIPGYQVLEMPYEDLEFTMLIVMPDEIKGIAKALNTAALQTWLKALSKPMKVKVYMPRFKMEHSLKALPEIFQSMGMKDAFSYDRADFSGIMKPSTDSNLFISDIAHQAFLQVQEDGTEAAAATVIGMSELSMPLPEPEIPVFRADQPFLCLILHKPDNTILFAGKVVNPEPAEGKTSKDQKKPKTLPRIEDGQFFKR